MTANDHLALPARAIGDMIDRRRRRLRLGALARTAAARRERPPREVPPGHAVVTGTAGRGDRRRQVHRRGARDRSLGGDASRAGARRRQQRRLRRMLSQQLATGQRPRTRALKEFTVRPRRRSRHLAERVQAPTPSVGEAANDSAGRPRRRPGPRRRTTTASPTSSSVPRTAVGNGGQRHRLQKIGPAAARRAALANADVIIGGEAKAGERAGLRRAVAREVNDDVFNDIIIAAAGVPRAASSARGVRVRWRRGPVVDGASESELERHLRCQPGERPCPPTPRPRPGRRRLRDRPA